MAVKCCYVKYSWGSGWPLRICNYRRCLCSRRELPKPILSELIKSPLFWHCLLDAPIPAALPSWCFCVSEFTKTEVKKNFSLLQADSVSPRLSIRLKKEKGREKTTYTARYTATSDPEMHYKFPVAGFRQAINKTAEPTRDAPGYKLRWKTPVLHAESMAQPFICNNGAILLSAQGKQISRG